MLLLTQPLLLLPLVPHDKSHPSNILFSAVPHLFQQELSDVDQHLFLLLGTCNKHVLCFQKAFDFLHPIRVNPCANSTQVIILDALSIDRIRTQVNL